MRAPTIRETARSLNGFMASLLLEASEVSSNVVGRARSRAGDRLDGKWPFLLDRELSSVPFPHRWPRFSSAVPPSRDRDRARGRGTGAGLNSKYLCRAALHCPGCDRANHCRVKGAVIVGPAGGDRYSGAGGTRRDVARVECPVVADNAVDDRIGVGPHHGLVRGRSDGIWAERRVATLPHDVRLPGRRRRRRRTGIRAGVVVSSPSAAARGEQREGTNAYRPGRNNRIATSSTLRSTIDTNQVNHTRNVSGVSGSRTASAAGKCFRDS